MEKRLHIVGQGVHRGPVPDVQLTEILYTMVAS